MNRYLYSSHKGKLKSFSKCHLDKYSIFDFITKGLLRFSNGVPMIGIV